jgi:hypothetical protein
MSDVGVAPPATGIWYDTAATVAAVQAVLRLQSGDVDEDRLTALVPVAAGIIDDYIDGTVALTGPPALPQVQHALERTVIDLYVAGTPATAAAVVSWLPEGVVRNLLDPIIGTKRARHGVA